jgi:hypothetical protein
MVREGEAAMRKNISDLLLIVTAHRRFSLINNTLACHSERSEESPGPFTLTLKYFQLV